MYRFEKDPNDVLDYGLDWALWLNSDTITASSWSISGEDTELVQDSDSNTTTTTEVWLSGGSAGVTYAVANHITTTAGRESDRTLLITVVQR